MEVYRVVSHPVIEATTGNLIIAEPEGRYFLKEKSQGAYLVLQEAEMAQCMGDLVKVCPAQFPVYHSSTPTCVNAMFQGNITLAKLKCQWKIAVGQMSDMWVWNEYNSSWMYGLPQKTRVHLQCRNDGGFETKESTLLGVGQLSVAPGCSLWTTQYRLLPISEGNKTVMRSSWEDPTPKAVPTLNLTTGKWDEADFQEAFKSLQGVKEEGPEFNSGIWADWWELRREVQRVQMRREERVKRYLGGSLFVVGTIISLGIAGGVWLWRRKLAPKAKGTEKEDIERGAPEVEQTTSSPPTKKIHFPTQL